MRMEVHVHGTAFMCKGVHLSQIEDALRDVRTLQMLWDSNDAPWAVWTRGSSASLVGEADGPT